MKLFGLIGFPLSHSFSKHYFTQKFSKENIVDCLFENFQIANIEEFTSIIKSKPELKGLSITIPYKESVLQYVDEQTPEVAAIGATNCLSFNNDKIVAHNTDVIGFEKSFAKHLKPHHKKALILGTGGAAKAIKYVLKKIGIEYLTVSRKLINNDGFIYYEDVDKHIMDDYKIIINCTPLGMYPNEKSLPDLPYDFITPQHYLFDLVYNPPLTCFLKEGKNRGAIIENGFEMLVSQAEENWKIWNDELKYM